MLMTNRPKSKRFSVGDRVVTKPNLTVSTNVHQHEQRNPKHGTVTGIVYKQNKNGASHPYVEVHWDNHSRVDLHAANRLWMEKDLKEKMADFRESLT
jgi:hypothetical protein|tara:strand:- start:7137 stop:7427 length:291 start_codon:yes stop_codon:yes gene_type:complete